MSAPPVSLDNALARWRNNLIDLSRRNPLLSLKVGPSSSLTITAPDVLQVFDALVNKKIIHRNQASRHKSRLAAHVKALS